MKRLVMPSGARWLYDAKGECLGKEVLEVEAFTEEELQTTGTMCSECGKPNGYHGEYFVKTGQCGAGSVEGHYQRCSKIVLSK